MSQPTVAHYLVSRLAALGVTWSEDAYLWLTDHARRLVEFTDGYLRVHGDEYHDDYSANNDVWDVH